MKIELDLPDWVTIHDRIRITVNQELLAFSEPGTWDMLIKVNRCVKCGTCCLDISDKHTPFGTIDGACAALDRDGEEWLCRAGSRKPDKCIDDPNKTLEKAVFPDCAITHRLVRIN